MPGQPWFRLGEEPEYLTASREYAIRAYAALEGFENLRGFWAWMKSKSYDYYDIIRMSYQ
jgi:hypothetical protein